MIHTEPSAPPECESTVRLELGLGLASLHRATRWITVLGTAERCLERKLLVECNPCANTATHCLLLGNRPARMGNWKVEILSFHARSDVPVATTGSLRFQVAAHL